MMHDQTAAWRSWRGIFTSLYLLVIAAVIQVPLFLWLTTGFEFRDEHLRAVPGIPTAFGLLLVTSALVYWATQPVWRVDAGQGSVKIRWIIRRLEIPVSGLRRVWLEGGTNRVVLILSHGAGTIRIWPAPPPESEVMKLLLRIST